MVGLQIDCNAPLCVGKEELKTLPCCLVVDFNSQFLVDAAGVVVYNFVAGGIHVAQTAPLHLHSLPVTFGLSAFVYSGHAVFPSIYRSMKDRSQYPRMLDTTYFIVGVTGALIGIAPTALCLVSFHTCWPSTSQATESMHKLIVQDVLAHRSCYKAALLPQGYNAKICVLQVDHPSTPCLAEATQNLQGDWSRLIKLQHMSSRRICKLSHNVGSEINT